MKRGLSEHLNSVLLLLFFFLCIVFMIEVYTYSEYKEEIKIECQDYCEDLGFDKAKYHLSEKSCWCLSHEEQKRIW